MKKKIKLFSTIATLCLSLAMLAFGVLSAITVTYKTTGTITYEVEDTYVEIETRVFSTSKRYSTDAELKVQSQSFEGSSFAAITALTTTGLVESADVSYEFSKVQIKNLDKGSGYTVQESDYVDTYSSVASMDPPQDLSIDLKYKAPKDEDEGVYTYFVVTKVVNKSTLPLYTYVPTTGDDKYVAPENSYTYKDDGYNELSALNDEAYIVFAMSLKDVTTPIDMATFVFPISITKEFTDVPQNSQVAGLPEIGIVGSIATKEEVNVDLSKENYTTAQISTEESYFQANIYQSQNESYSSFSVVNSSMLSQNPMPAAATTAVDISFNINFNGGYINITSEFFTLEQAQAGIVVYAGKFSNLDEAKNSSTKLTTTITTNANGSYFTLSIQNGSNQSFSIFVVHSEEIAEMLHLGAIGYFGIKTEKSNLTVIASYGYVTMPVEIEVAYPLAVGSLCFYMPNATVGQQVEFKFNASYLASPIIQDLFGFTTDTDYSSIDYSEVMIMVKDHYTVSDMVTALDDAVMITNGLIITPTLTADNELTDFSVKFNVAQEYLDNNGNLKFSLFMSFNQEFVEEGVNVVDFNVYSSTQNLNVVKINYTYVEGTVDFELNKEIVVAPKKDTTILEFAGTTIPIVTYSFDFKVSNIKSNHGYLVLDVKGLVGDLGVGVFEGEYGDGLLVTNEYGIPSNFGSSTPFSSLFNIDDTTQKFEINLRYAKNGVLEFCIVTTSFQIPISSWRITGHLEDYTEAVYELKTDSNGNEYYSFKYLRDRTLKTFNMPDTYNGKDILEIGERAFDGAACLIHLTLSNKVKTIGDYAFANTKLMSLTIPESLETIGSWAFNNCNRLVQFRDLSNKYVSLSGVWSDMPIECVHDRTTQFSGVFSDYDENGIMFYTINGKKYIMDYIGNDTVVDLSQYTDVYGLADMVFRGNTKITKIILPEGMVWVGRECFNNMPNLRLLILSSTISQIEKSAFSYINSSSDLIIQINSSHFPSEYMVSNVVYSTPYRVNWTLMVPKGCLSNFTSTRVGPYEVAAIIEAE